MQEIDESVDDFVANVRRLERSCEYETLDDSIMCDRIVVGIRNVATRRKLLQTRQLDLNKGYKAVDNCKANEVAMKQLKATTTPNDVNNLNK